MAVKGELGLVLVGNQKEFEQAAGTRFMGGSGMNSGCRGRFGKNRR